MMANVTLKNVQGIEKTYENVPKIWLESADGTTLEPFTYGEAVSKTVSLDFSKGNMSVAIPDGELVSKLLITKPEELVSQNVAEGINIAGIIGTLKSVSQEIVGAGIEIMMSDYFYAKGTWLDTWRLRTGTSGTGGGATIETRHDRTYFQKTFDTAPVQLVSGHTYMVSFVDAVYVEAYEITSFSTFGKCVVIGNKSIVTGKKTSEGDNTKEEFLIIYQVNTNKLIVFVDTRPGDLNAQYSYGSEIVSEKDIMIYDISDIETTYIWKHEKNRTPDFAMLFFSGTAIRPMYGIPYVWGVSSRIKSVLDPTGKMAGGAMLCAPSGYLFLRTEKGIDESNQNASAIKVISDNEIAMQCSKNLPLYPTMGYRWVAIWGVSETE